MLIFLISVLFTCYFLKTLDRVETKLLNYICSKKTYLKGQWKHEPVYHEE